MLARAFRKIPYRDRDFSGVSKISKLQFWLRMIQDLLFKIFFFNKSIKCLKQLFNNIVNINSLIVFEYLIGLAIMLLAS